MKKVSIKSLSFIPASHEDFDAPGVVKKVLFTKKDIAFGRRIQMINWARLAKNKSFVSHYHEDMDEIFIMVSGRVRIQVNKESEMLERGDAILVPMRVVHKMENICKNDVNYIVIGMSRDTGGKTVIVDQDKSTS